MSTLRAMVEKWAMGLRSVSGCTHLGIASIGVRPPDSMASGGVMKKLMSCVWLAERAKGEINVPRPMPLGTQHAQAERNRPGVPRDGTPRSGEHPSELQSQANL